MFNFLKPSGWGKRVRIPLAPGAAFAALIMCTVPTLSAQGASVIVLQLKNDLVQSRQQAMADVATQRALNTLAQSVPDLQAALRRSLKRNGIPMATYDIDRVFTVDVSDKTAAERNQLQQGYLNNPLVLAADLNDVTQIPEQDSGRALANRRGARTNTDLEALYKRDSVALPGYLVGGINSDAVSVMPGGKGEYARVVIASDNYWNLSHQSLPSLAFSPIPGPQRLSCGTDYKVGNNATAAAGIIAGKESATGVVGIVPRAQLAATPATFASIYDNIYNLGLKPGDVVVLDQAFSSTTIRLGDFSPYPGDVCPKSKPTDKFGVTCQLPSVGYESTQRRIEILTEELGVHVIVNASGGTAYAQDPATAMDLDARAFNGLFDRDRNDDGAIYVAGIDPKTGASLAANYGRRIDLSTWATRIAYPSFTANGGHDSYSRYDRDDVLNYPLAAYIVAGAVAQVQSVAVAKGLGPVPPWVMRKLLVETGHPIPGQDVSKPNGKQPDVKAAVDKLLAEYGRGFPPKPAAPFRIKRVVGFDAPYYGRDWEYRPIVTSGHAQGVTYQWSVPESPLEEQAFNPADGTRQMNVLWSDGLTPRLRTITLTARDKQGATDTWSRQLSVPPLVWRYDGQWDVPDQLAPGQTAVFSGQLKAPVAAGRPIYYYWRIPALLPAIREDSAPMPSPTVLTAAVPDTLAPGSAIDVQLLATEQPLRASSGGAAQLGMLLSKKVNIVSGSGAGPTGGLTVPASVTGNSHYVFKVDNPSETPLSYSWVLPSGFANPGNSPTAMGFAPHLAASTAAQVKVQLTNARGQSTTLSKDVMLTANLPSGEIEGPSPSIMNAGETRVFVVKATLPDGGTPTYRWSVPLGFGASGALTERLTLTAPMVSQTMNTTVSVIVSGRSNNQVVLNRNLTVNPSAVAPGDEPCATPWSSASVYATPGVRVSFGGFNYEVAHWTQAQQPDLNFVLTGSAAPWRRLGTCQP